MAPPAPSLRENAPASSSSRTSRNPSAPPKSVAASAFFLRLTPYPLRLWIGEFFRGSLDPTAAHRSSHRGGSSSSQIAPGTRNPPCRRGAHRGGGRRCL